MIEVKFNVGVDVMTAGDIAIIVIVIVGAIGVGLFFLNRWASRKNVEQLGVIERTKQTATLFIIDKKRDKIDNVNLPKAAAAQMPKWYKFMKMYFVMAKVGPQIVTLMCDKRVYEQIQPKKTIKADLAGLYIVSVKGMKTEAEMKQTAKERKAAKKAEAKAAKGK